MYILKTNMLKIFAASKHFPELATSRFFSLTHPIILTLRMPVRAPLRQAVRRRNDETEIKSQGAKQREVRSVCVCVGGRRGSCYRQWCHWHCSTVTAETSCSSLWRPSKWGDGIKGGFRTMKLKRWQNRGSAQPDQTGSFDGNLNPLNIAADEEEFFWGGGEGLLSFNVLQCPLTIDIRCSAPLFKKTVPLCFGATRQVRESERILCAI